MFDTHTDTIHPDTGFSGHETEEFIIMPRKDKYYIKSEDQTDVPTGLVRYQIDIRIKGIRKRPKIVCSPEEIDQVFNEWYESQTQPLFGETIDEWLSYYTQTHRNKSYAKEVASKVEVIKSIFKNKTLASITRRDIESLITAMLKRGIMRATVNRYLAVASKFFNWAIDHQIYTNPNPVSRMKLDEDNIREIEINREQMDEIHAKVMTITEPNFRVALLTALLTGMRRGEIATMLWQDYDEVNRVVTIRAKNAKSKKRRNVYIPKILASEFENLPRSDPRIIPWHPDTITHNWIKFRPQLSFLTPYGKLKLHDLRHVYAQFARQAGISLDDLCDALGHHDPGFTRKRYAQTGRGIAGQVDAIADFILPTPE